MENQDRQLIQSLFSRLSEVEKQAPPRDADAEALIKERLNQQPAAPYFMAQTIVMQEYALQQAQERIEALERQVQERPTGGGLFGSLFGGGQSGSRDVRRAPQLAPPSTAFGGMQNRGGGGFLAGAAQTAMGVAGGVLLGNAIGGMFGSNEAKAAETPPESAETTGSEHDSGDSFDSGFGGDGDL
jgi:uncharacterized protein